MDSSKLTQGDSAAVSLRLGVQIPMRDGVNLAATVYLPKGTTTPGPAIFTLTPYLTDTFHSAGIYFATHGFAFLVVDCRGRGSSGGTFRPNVGDGADGYDIVEWVAKQDWCNGKVAMGGGSYSGWNQWATAGTRPPHLSALMPRCAPQPGVDFPARNNILDQYALQWLTYVSGTTLQQNLFYDQGFWSSLWKDRFLAGKAFDTLPFELGQSQTHLLDWIAHPEQGTRWDNCAPSIEDYGAMDFPVLSITGAYDDNQYGTFAYHRNAMANGSAAFRERLYLIIGPWDHGGVGAPQPRIGGVEFGPDALLDFRQLSVEWYRWTMSDGPKPAFLKDHVAYYVAGLEQWRYASSLEAVTARHLQLNICPSKNGNRLSSPGRLSLDKPTQPGVDSYVYDPTDTSIAELEASLPFFDPAETRLIVASDGKQLVYTTEPFDQDIEVSGFFRLDAWLSIDQPDTDFRVLVHIVAPDGSTIQISNATMRARYREGQRAAVLIQSDAPLLYHFEGFAFASRIVHSGDRLHLVIGPYDSIYTQKNFNGGGIVSAESLQDAKAVTVKLVSTRERPSILHVPIG